MRLYLYFNTEKFTSVRRNIMYYIDDSNEGISAERLDSFADLLYAEDDFYIKEDILYSGFPNTNDMYQWREFTIEDGKLKESEVWVVSTYDLIKMTLKFDVLSHAEFDNYCYDLQINMEYNMLNDFAMGEGGKYYVKVLARKYKLKSCKHIKKKKMMELDYFYFLWSTRSNSLGYTRDLELVKELQEIIRKKLDLKVYKCVRANKDITIYNDIINLFTIKRYYDSNAIDFGKEITYKGLAKYKLLG